MAYNLGKRIGSLGEVYEAGADTAQLPDPVLGHMLIQPAYTPLVKFYDQAVSGELAFSYCNVVADFYEKLFRLTTAYGVREMILRRLPILGWSHKRWHVRETFASLVSDIKDESLILLVKDILSENPAMAEWNRPSMEGYRLPRQIAEILYPGSH